MLVLNKDEIFLRGNLALEILASLVVQETNSLWNSGAR